MPSVSQLQGPRDGPREHRGDGRSTALRYSAMVRSFFRRNRSDNADDLTQQTLVNYLESRGRFRGESSASTYLIGIARNNLRAHRRRLERAFRIEAAFLDAGPPSSGRSAEGLEKALLRGIQQLPAELHLVLDLFYWRGIPQNTIARRLGVPVGTVASRLRRAKEKLRAFIVSYLED